MGEIVGLKIKDVRKMTSKEMKAEGWDGDCFGVTCIVLEDGTKIYSSRDSEGNGPGALFGVDGKTKKTIMIEAY